MATPRVLIASPTPGTVKTAYMKSVFGTMIDLRDRGITAEFLTEEGSDIPLGRNILASKFLQTDCTHLLFVDTDMMFPHDACARLLAADKPLIGAIYSSRGMNNEFVDRAVRSGMSLHEAFLFGCSWQLYLPDEQTGVSIENGITRVDAIGFGLALLSRSVLEAMVANGSAPMQRKTNEKAGQFYNFFAPHYDVNAEIQHISEDISFCRRWRKECGGEIWAWADSPLFHIGDYGYGGSYTEYIKAINKAAARSRRKR